MKKNIYLYLFIFFLLISLFTYMYLSNQLKAEAHRADALSEKVEKLQDSLAVNNDLRDRAEYFSLEQNLNARNYFQGQDIDALAIKVRDSLYATNKPEKNTLIEYAPLNNAPYRINKMKILNNRWIIADFTDGKIWGELLIRYFIEDNGDVTFEIAETLLHPNSMY